MHERALLAVRRRVEEAIDAARTAGRVPGPRLVAVRDDLARALDDAARGAFPRLLRRPLWQLGGDAPARTTFDRFAARLSAEADQALRLQPALDRVWAQWDALHERHAARLPTLLARELADAAIDRGRLERLRLPADADLLHDRLARVADRMRDWAADADAGASWSAAIVAPSEPLTPAELGALVARARRERTARTAAADHAAALRSRLASHAARAATLGDGDPRVPAPRDGADALAAIVRALLLIAVQLGQPNAYGAADGALWSWALAAAAGTRAAAWSTADLTRLPPDLPADAPTSAVTTRQIIPLTTDDPLGTLVWVTADLPAAVRVWDATLRLGAAFAGRIVLSADATGGDLAQQDVAALYEGAESTGSRWYRAVEKVRLVAVAHHDRDWIGRVVRRGAVDVVPTPVWEATNASPDTVRVVRPAPAHADRSAAVLVAPLGEAGAAFAGATTLEVRAPFAGDGRAWLRTSALDASLAAGALEREYALFEEMARRAPGAPDALTPLGFARVSPHAAAVPLYRRPLATGPGLGELTAAWLHDPAARAALVAAIARVLVAVHAAGAALGVVHPDAFAYTLAHPSADAALAPRAILAHAPAATPLGAPFDRRWATAVFTLRPGLVLPRLRAPAVGATLREGGPATRGRDAAAFLLCAVDLLAVDPLPATRGALAPHVTAHRDRFAAPVLAMQLATLWDANDEAAMIRVVDRMAAGTRGGSGD